MPEAEEHDALFAALKHPLRRRILLFLDKKGEVSFTDIQKAVGTQDTGLLSYHLKELALLVSQSTRGRYRLTETGKRGVALLKKKKRAEDVPGVVHKEVGKLVAEVVYFFAIVAITLIIPLSVDIYTSVELIYSGSALTISMFGLYVVSLLALYVGVILFTFYHRAYFSKVPRKNLLYSTLFGAGIALILFYSSYTQYLFNLEAISLMATSQSSSTDYILYGPVISRTVLLIVGSPFMAYLTCKLSERRSEKGENSRRLQDKTLF